MASRKPPSTRPRPQTGKRGPELVGEVIGRLFTARGWGRRQERTAIEEAWFKAVGADAAQHTRVEQIRRGVVEVAVDNAVLLQELAHFRKRELLEKLRRKLPGQTLTDLRFRAGVVR